MKPNNRVGGKKGGESITIEKRTIHLQFSIVGGARTDLSATWAVQLVRTGPLAAIGASPAFGTGARTVRDVANGSVQTLSPPQLKIDYFLKIKIQFLLVSDDDDTIFNV